MASSVHNIISKDTEKKKDDKVAMYFFLCVLYFSPKILRGDDDLREQKLLYSKTKKKKINKY